MPARWHAGVPPLLPMTNTYRRRSSTVSTWKKSTARSLGPGTCRNACQVRDRTALGRGAGFPASLRIRQTVRGGAEAYGPGRSSFARGCAGSPRERGVRGPISKPPAPVPVLWVVPGGRTGSPQDAGGSKWPPDEVGVPGAAGVRGGDRSGRSWRSWFAGAARPGQSAASARPVRP